MSAVQKFSFDNRFDSQREVEEAARVEAHETTLRVTREEGYAAGLEAGRTAALRDIESRIESVVTALIPEIQGLVAAQAEAAAAARKNAVAVAATILKRLYPSLERENGPTEAERLIVTCLEEMAQEPRLVIRLGPDMIEMLKTRIDDLAAAAGFPGQLVMVPADDLTGADVRIEWADGGVSRDGGHLWAAIEETVNRALADGPGAFSLPASPETAEDNTTSPKTTDAKTPDADRPDMDMADTDMSERGETNG
ncbi:MAG: FliH/SctL family protein [Alphaproteobacteria bacterium]